MSEIVAKTLQSVEQVICAGAFLYGESSTMNKVTDWIAYANSNNSLPVEKMLAGTIFLNASNEKCFTFNPELINGQVLETNFYRLPVMHTLHLKGIAKKTNKDENFIATIKLSREELFGITPLPKEKMDKFPLGDLPERLIPIFKQNSDNGGTGRSTSKTAAAGYKNPEQLVAGVVEAEQKRKTKKKVEAENLKHLSTAEIQDFHRRKTEQEIFRDSDFVTTINTVASKKTDEFKWVDTLELRTSENSKFSWRYVDNAKNPSGIGNSATDTRIAFGIGSVNKTERKLTLIITSNIDELKMKELAFNFIQSSLVKDISIHTENVANYLDTNWCFYSQSNYKIFGIEYK